MEYNDSKVNEEKELEIDLSESVKKDSENNLGKKEWIQIIFNILLAITIGTLIFTTITLIRNAEEIKNDPIDYAIKNSNIERCTCFNSEGQIHNYGREGSSEINFTTNLVIKNRTR